jgi:prephenate dehydratase
MPATIAIQGDKASFHDIAADQFFPADSERVFCDTFSETFRALADDRAKYALCAIENTLHGSISEVYDLLLKHKFYSIGEVYVRIKQCLIALPGASLEQIMEIYSHPVALAQCEVFLDAKLPNAERIEHHDTAASVAFIKQLSDPTKAAIASRAAAELHGLPILADSIETHHHNYTRFVVLSKTDHDAPPKPTKTSLAIITPNIAGSLYAALGCFANRSMNLSKIESRPILGKPWHELFYIDVDAGLGTTAFTEALDELKQQGCEITVLGSYLAAMPLVNDEVVEAEA